MALLALWNPNTQFLKTDGTINAGGKIVVTDHNDSESIPANYSDADGTTLNHSPIVLDALGRATCYIGDGRIYDLYVKDANGATLWTVSKMTPGSETIVVRDGFSVSSNDSSVAVVISVDQNGVTNYDLSIQKEIDRATEAEKGLSDAIETEKNRAEGAESTLSKSIADETKRATEAEKGLSGSIETEKNRAEGVESTLSESISKETERAIAAEKASRTEIVAGYNITVEKTVGADGHDVYTVSGEREDNLVDDVRVNGASVVTDKVANIDVPVAGTASPLMDGKASVGNSLKYAREDHVHPSDTSREDKANKTTVVLGTSDSKYPTDKAVAEFVNSSIATNTANYISNNGEPFTSVEQLEAYSGPVTNNDYAFVTGTDSEGNTYYDRYKATVSGETVTWALEYRLNNSSFTAAQWSAINSGITSVLVAKIHTHSNKDVLDGITSTDVANWDSKQNSLTAGNNITIDGSTISSDQVFVATYGVTKYAEVKAAYDAGKICTVFRNSRYYYISWVHRDYIEFMSSNEKNTLYHVSVSSDSKWVNYTSQLQPKLTFDTAPTAGSNNPVTSDGIKKELDTKLNVDGSNATTAGVTAMMKKVATGRNGVDDDSTYFGGSNDDNTQIVRRRITDIWYYINKKVKTHTLGSVGSADKPIYLENGVPKVCTDGVPYSEASYGENYGYGVFVGGENNLANSSRCYCTFLVTVSSYPDNIAHTYIGTFSFRGGILNSELKCLTGTPAYPHRIVVASNVDGGTTENPTYTVGLYVIPADKTYKHSNYKLTRIASDSDFIWNVRTLSDAEYDSCNSVAKPALRPIILRWDASASNVTTTGGTWIPTFDKATIIDARGIVDMSIQVDLSIIGQRTYIDTLSSYEITLVNSSKTDILPVSLHQAGRMPRQAYSSSSTIDGTIDTSCTHRFIFPITSATNLLSGYRPKITLPNNYPLDSGAQVNIRALCRGIVLPYGADEYF